MFCSKREIFLRFFCFPGHIRIKILPPIPTKGRTPEDLEQLIDESYAILSENVQLISSVEEKNANYKVKAN